MTISSLRRSDSVCNDRIYCAARFKTTAFVGLIPASSIAGITVVSISNPSLSAFRLFFSAFKCKIRFLSSGCKVSLSSARDDVARRFLFGISSLLSFVSESEIIASELDVEAT